MPRTLLAVAEIERVAPSLWWERTEPLLDYCLHHRDIPPRPKRPALVARATLGQYPRLLIRAYEEAGHGGVTPQGDPKLRAEPGPAAPAGLALTHEVDDGLDYPVHHDIAEPRIGADPHRGLGNPIGRRQVAGDPVVQA
jgi:hypothetical protein